MKTRGNEEKKTRVHLIARQIKAQNYIHYSGGMFETKRKVWIVREVVIEGERSRR